MALTWGDISTAVIFNCGIAAVCFVVFCILRRMSLFYDFYNAKRRLAIPFRYIIQFLYLCLHWRAFNALALRNSRISREIQVLSLPRHRSQIPLLHKTRFRPRHLVGGLFSWISQVTSVPDEQVARVAGFDGLAYIKFLNLCMRIAAGVMLICMVVLLPTNLTSDNVSAIMKDQVGCATEEDDEAGAQAAAAAGAVNADQGGKCSYVVTEFDKTALTNVETEHWKLWIYIVAIYMITIMTLYLLWTHYRQQINWRILYLSWLRRGDAGHTVLVRDIPVPGLSAPKSMLPSFLLDDASVFEHQPEKIYELDTDTVRPEQATTVGTDASPAPSPLIARTSLSNFVSRPPETDLDTFAQVDKALNSKISMAAVVRREFQRTFGADQVQEVAVVCDDSSLAPLVAEYEKTKEKVKDLTDEWVGTMRAGCQPSDKPRKYIKRKRVKLALLPGALGKATGSLGGPDKEALEHFGKDAQDADELEFNVFKMKTLLNSIHSEQKASREKETQTAFVVMRTRQTRAAAATGLLHADGTAWKTEGAPASNEVIWGNVATPASRRMLGSLASWAILIGIMVFFLPIIAALQQLVNLEGYAKPGNWAEWLLDAPVLGNILKSIMPTLALVIILAVMPILIKLMADKIEKQPTKSAVDFSLGTKYYCFQFFVIFLFNTIIGAASSGKASGDDMPVVSLYNELKDDPGQITDWLADAIPQQAGFFFMYLLTKGILAGSISFLRVPGAVISWLLSKFSTSERAKKRTWSKQYMSYGVKVPSDALAILILLVFSFVQPLVSVAALMYFILASLYWKYDLMYSYRDAYQTGGMFWPVMFDMIYASVLIFLLSAIGILGVKVAEGAPLLIPLFVGAIVWRIVVQRQLARPLKEMSMHTAADLDRQDLKTDWLKDVTPEEAEMMRKDNWDLEDVDLDPIPLRYVQPSLKLRDDVHDRVVEDAAEASRLADAYNKDAKLDSESFIQVYNSTGPFHGVPDAGGPVDKTQGIYQAV